MPVGQQYWRVSLGGLDTFPMRSASDHQQDRANDDENFDASPF